MYIKTRDLVEKITQYLKRYHDSPFGHTLEKIYTSSEINDMIYSLNGSNLKLIDNETHHVIINEGKPFIPLITQQMILEDESDVFVMDTMENRLNAGKMGFHIFINGLKVSDKDINVFPGLDCTQLFMPQSFFNRDSNNEVTIITDMMRLDSYKSFHYKNIDIVNNSVSCPINTYEDINWMVFADGLMLNDITLDYDDIANIMTLVGIPSTAQNVEVIYRDKISFVKSGVLEDGVAEYSIDRNYIDYNHGPINKDTVWFFADGKFVFRKNLRQYTNVNFANLSIEAEEYKYVIFDRNVFVTDTDTYIINEDYYVMNWLKDKTIDLMRNGQTFTFLDNLTFDERAAMFDIEQYDDGTIYDQIQSVLRLNDDDGVDELIELYPFLIKEYLANKMTSNNSKIVYVPNETDPYQTLIAPGGIMDMARNVILSINGEFNNIYYIPENTGSFQVPTSAFINGNNNLLMELVIGDEMDKKHFNRTDCADNGDGTYSTVLTYAQLNISDVQFTLFKRIDVTDRLDILHLDESIGFEKIDESLYTLTNITPEGYLGSKINLTLNDGLTTDDHFILMPSARIYIRDFDSIDYDSVTEAEELCYSLLDVDGDPVDLSGVRVYNKTTGQYLINNIDYLITSVNETTAQPTLIIRRRYDDPMVFTVILGGSLTQGISFKNTLTSLYGLMFIPDTVPYDERYYNIYREGILQYQGIDFEVLSERLIRFYLPRGANDIVIERLVVSEDRYIPIMENYLETGFEKLVRDYFEVDISLGDLEYAKMFPSVVNDPNFLPNDNPIEYDTNIRYDIDMTALLLYMKSDRFSGKMLSGELFNDDLKKIMTTFCIKPPNFLDIDYIKMKFDVNNQPMNIEINADEKTPYEYILDAFKDYMSTHDNSIDVIDTYLNVFREDSKIKNFIYKDRDLPIIKVIDLLGL